MAGVESFLSWCAHLKWPAGAAFLVVLAGGCGLEAGGLQSGVANSSAPNSQGQGGSAGASGAGGQGGAGGEEVFMPPLGCGDGAIGEQEACDDGNNNDNDTCTKDCQCGVKDPASDVLAFQRKADTQCYILFNNSRNFPGAQGDCENRSMVLAAISNQSELNDIAPYVNKSVWIGGYKSSGVWKWVSGEPWLIKPCDASTVAECDDTVDLWASGQPSGSGEDKTTLLGDKDQFNDEQWYEGLPYLCEAK